MVCSLHIYKLENVSFVRLKNLNYATLYLKNFDKQKVSLARNVFSEKAVAVLELELNDKKDSAVLVNAVT